MFLLEAFNPKKRDTNVLNTRHTVSLLRLCRSLGNDKRSFENGNLHVNSPHHVAFYVDQWQITTTVNMFLHVISSQSPLSLDSWNIHLDKWFNGAIFIKHVVVIHWWWLPNSQVHMDWSRGSQLHWDWPETSKNKQFQWPNGFGLTATWLRNWGLNVAIILALTCHFASFFLNPNTTKTLIIQGISNTNHLVMA